MTCLRASVLGAALLAIAACGTKKPAPRSAPAPAAPVASAPAARGVQGAASAAWSYSSVGKRDPFRSFLAELTANTRQADTVCATPLGRFDLDQLKLVAVVTGLDDPVAMVEGPNGTGYTLRRGSCIGRNGGIVSAVRTQEVVISESIVRANGVRERTEVLLRLPKEPTLEIEE